MLLSCFFDTLLGRVRRNPVEENASETLLQKARPFLGNERDVCAAGVRFTVQRVFGALDGLGRSDTALEKAFLELLSA